MPSTDKKEDLLPQESPPDSYDPTENEIGVEVKATRRVSGLSVLTWNVWFGDSYETEESFSKRCQEIVVSLGQTQPDIICLQEVTQDLLDLLLGAGWVKAGYDLSCVKIEGYGVLIMSRGELNGKFEETRLPTHMGRSLHTVHVELSSGRRRTTTITSSSSSSSSYQPSHHHHHQQQRYDLSSVAKKEEDKRGMVIGCVHLESLDNAKLRREQLAIVIYLILAP
mmetsp:Transcript_39403/g.63112  ORF Transcript_39403/g.63112 Transcript_39403/m.63112 type:complete len:224 (+) Transcript_39403:68-739(+)